VKQGFAILALCVLAMALYLAGAVFGLYGEHRGAGVPTAAVVPDSVLEARAEAQRSVAAARGVGDAKQILFGDLHVHTTFSTDAFLFSLPISSGEGAHPLGDACDFARFCSGLDFWSINDHAEASTPQRWQETKEAIRQCNAVAGDPESPDVMAFLGWEWTQIGRSAADHWGHKNVVLRETAEELVPRRPIHSGGFARDTMANAPTWARLLPAVLQPGERQEYYDFDTFVREIGAVPDCPPGVDTRELPEDCAEGAETPGELFEKLAQWGGESLVIPHGTTWGIYTPPDATWEKQLTTSQHDPQRQTLIEVYSGHGNSEEYRSWSPLLSGADGATCPEPTENYLPSCWRAGELIRARCLEAGEGADECAQRAATARQHHADAGLQGEHTVPGVGAEEWLDAGQCRDCFLPSFNYRPAGSAQFIAALSETGADGRPLRFRFGFVAASDVHSGRPGTGYKEFARTSMTDQFGPPDAGIGDLILGSDEEPIPASRAVDLESADALGQLGGSEFERQGSFWLTGGLTAVHAARRTRDGVWDALQRREVYGTSGDRILLWFDLVNGPKGARVPMGGEVALGAAPRFEVRAAGAFEQKPGCPDYSTGALAPESIERLCRGECYHPADRRKRIARIEVVRIRPRVVPGEPVDALIDDPWRSFECPDDPAGCTVTFEDPDHAAIGRDSLYYARAVQEASPAVNARNLRCQADETGACAAVDPCWSDYRTPESDTCLDPAEERAWSSPIYVDWPRG
jgi:hypothetical protein